MSVLIDSYRHSLTRVSKQRKIIEMARSAGMLRPRDLEAVGISGELLNRMYARGLLNRVSRGVYVLPDTEPDQHFGLAETCKRVPKGNLCLLSALRFHELTTTNPYETWIAIGIKDRPPRFDFPPLRVVRFSQAALSFGIEKHATPAGEVRVYSPAKTVADCFKYRNKVGVDLAIEALRDCWSQKKATADKLWEAAEVCRVANVIKPYLEAHVA